MIDCVAIDGAAAVVGDASAALDEDAELEGLMVGGVVEGRDVVGDGGLRGGDADGQQEGEEPDCGWADALLIPGH